MLIFDQYQEPLQLSRKNDLAILSVSALDQHHIAVADGAQRIHAEYNYEMQFGNGVNLL